MNVVRRGSRMTSVKIRSYEVKAYKLQYKSNDVSLDFSEAGTCEKLMGAFSISGVLKN